MARVISAISIYMLWSALPIDGQLCGENWHEYNTSCYSGFINPSHRLEQSDYDAGCPIDSELASVHSDDDNQFIEHLRNNIYEIDILLLGANDEQGQWLWKDGSDFDYMIWDYDFEPMAGTSTNYLLSEGVWYIASLPRVLTHSTVSGWVCQKPIKVYNADLSQASVVQGLGEVKVATFLVNLYIKTTAERSIIACVATCQLHPYCASVNARPQTAPPGGWVCELIAASTAGYLSVTLHPGDEAYDGTDVGDWTHIDLMPTQ